MILCPLPCIIPSRSGLHQQRPIARLREQEARDPFVEVSKDTIFSLGWFFLCRILAAERSGNHRRLHRDGFRIARESAA
jgi:hypothetical protein